MATSLHVTRVDRSPTGGIEMTFSDGTGREFASVAEMIAFADVSESITTEVLAKVACGWWLQRSPTAADDSLIEGKIFKFDVAQDAAVLGVS